MFSPSSSLPAASLRHLLVLIFAMDTAYSIVVLSVQAADVRHNGTEGVWVLKCNECTFSLYKGKKKVRGLRSPWQV